MEADDAAGSESLGAGGANIVFAQNLKTMIMPAFVLGSAIAATMMRHTRSAMLEVLRSDYVRTARAKGVRERLVPVRSDLQREVYVGLPLTEAIELTRAGCLEEDDPESIMELASW